MNRKIFLYLFLLTVVYSFGQESRVEEKYPKYFELPRETLFLHSNKTTYIVGEEAWFKVYAYDRKNHLSSKVTTNIHFTLHDQNGRVIKDKLFHAKEGLASGNVLIDSTLASGNYFFKVTTNWMKNFKEEDSFIQRVQVVNPNDNIRQNQKIFQKEYDFQLLPEGGYILADVKNTIGIKILDDQGKSTKCSGMIVNSKGEEITRFTTNFLGLGKFSFIPKMGEIYTAKVELPSGKKFDYLVERIEDRGISLSVNNLSKNDVIINLSTNQNSWKFIKEKNYKLLIHKDGVAKIIPIQFNNLSEQIIIAKEDLFKGINTITLFDTNENPLLERMFFNDKNITFRELTMKEMYAEGDSITYQLRTPLHDSLKVNASISVLPTQTKSYDPKHTILSTFYLKPYLKGTIEQPQYYFRKRNRKKVYELDILLLTQGWSRYDWNDIFNTPPKQFFEFQSGITLTGNLNSPRAKAKALLLYPTELNSSQLVEYDQKGAFRINNFFPMEEEQLLFSYTNKRGKAKRPRMALSSILNYKNQPIDTTGFGEEYRSFYVNKNLIPKNFLSENEVLDEIVIETRLDRVFKKGKFPFRGSIIKVNDSLLKIFRTLPEILRAENLNVRYGENITISSPFKGVAVLFYIDGVLQRPDTYQFLFNKSLHFYEDIYVDRGTPNALLINMFSRRTPFKNPDLNNYPFHIIQVKHGFEKAKKFYTPRYIDYNIEAFRDYGVIHWEPNAIIHNEEGFQFNMMNTGLKEVNFYIEGISSNGDLISQIITIKK